MAESSSTPEAALATFERRALRLLHLAAGRDAEAFRAAALAATGLELPPAPGRSARGQGVVAFWLGPCRWLVEGDAGAAADRLAASCGALGTVVEVTGGRVVLVVAGRDARLLLAAGCPLDLHPGTFPEGAAAPTLLAGVPVLLHALDEGVEVYAPRSYAGHLAAWLRHAAATVVA